MLLSAVLASPARAAVNAKDAHDCSAGPADIRIAASTRLIDRGGLDKSNLGAVYFDRANAFREKGAIDRAIADYGQALVFRPDLVAAYRSRGALLRGQGKLDAALKDFEAATRLAPADRDALLDSGATRDALHDQKGAIDDYDAVLKAQPDDVQALLDRGIARGEVRDFSGALADFATAAKIRPEAFEGFSGYCWISAVSGLSPERAVNACNRAVSLRPGDPAVLGYRALLWLRLGDYDSAVADYDNALGKSQDATLFFGRGIAQLRNGNPTGAKEDFAAADALDPHVAQVYAGYGIAP